MKNRVLTRLVFLACGLAVAAAGSVDGQIAKPAVSEPSPPAGRSGAEADAAYRFVVLADSRGDGHGLNGDALSAVFAGIADLDPAPRFVFFVGDLVYGRTSQATLRRELDEWRNVIQMHYPPNRVYPVFGGHERTVGWGAESAWSGFRNYFDPKTQAARGGEPDMVCHYYERKFNPPNNRPNFSRTVYYCDYAGDRFFVLNNDCVPPSHSVAGGGTDDYGCSGHELGCGQFNWLKDKLVSNGRRHNFFFHHEPAFATGAHHARSYRDQGCPQTPRYVMGNKKSARNDFVRLLGFNNATAMFSGHEHQYTWRGVTHDFVHRPLNNPGGIERSLALLIKADPVGQAAGPAVAYSRNGAAAAGRLGRAPNLRLWWNSNVGPPDWKGPIRAGRDDAEQFQKRGDAVDLTSHYLELMRDKTRGNHRFIALRWNNVPIPEGATIQKAHIYFRAAEGSAAGPRVKIMADASPFAFPFTRCRKDLQRRRRTPVTVRWQIGPWQKGRQYATPNLAPIIQNLLDRQGYGSRIPGQIPEIKTGSCGAPWYATSCEKFMGQIQGEVIRLEDYRGQGMPHHYAVVDVGQEDVSIAVRSWDGTPLPVPQQ